MTKSEEAGNRFANGARRRRDRARMRALGLPCSICGGAIDYGITDPHDPYCFEIDEVDPVARGGDLRWSNYQPAHRICNQLKGKRRGFKLAFTPFLDRCGRWVYRRADAESEPEMVVSEGSLSRW